MSAIASRRQSAELAGGRPTRTVQAVAIAFASLVILSLLAGRVWLIPAHFSTDPNEGWNAFQAARALGAGPLYPAPGALTSNNYPPVSFFVVGWLGRALGDNIVAGRVIALISVLIVAGIIFAAVRTISSRAAAGAMVGVLLFLAYNVTIFRSYLAMDDPQWLGHVPMTAGLCLLLTGSRHEPLGLWRIVSAALLMLAGGLVKHNLVAFPLAVTLWLSHDRRALVIWIATAALTLAAAAALLDGLYGLAFFADLFNADRHYSWLRMLSRSALPLAAMAPMIVVSLQLRKFRLADRRLDLLLLALLASVPLGMLQRGGQGVDRNAHFEALIALSIATGVSLGYAGPALSRPFRKLPWLIVPFAFLLPGAAQADLQDLLRRDERQAVWSMMQDRIAATSGRVACETSALCYWAGKSFELDFFLYGQHVAAHHDATALMQALAEHRFSAIQLNHATPHLSSGDIQDPLGPLISQSYRARFIDVDGRQLLTPSSLASDPRPNDLHPST